MLISCAAAELAEMQKAFDLHPLAVEDALVGHQRPKVEEYGDSLFAVLHLVEPASGGYEISLLVMGAIDVLLYFQFKRAKWL
jgi:magnesium transporter